MSKDIERYRMGLHQKLQELVALLEGAYVEYQNSPKLQAEKDHLAFWFPKRIAQMKERERATAHPDTAHSGARLLTLGSTAHLFEGQFDWYAGGDIRRTASHVGVLADAYEALRKNDPLKNQLCVDADAVLARSKA